ncbi:GNAT family acetyltransferase [Enterococcus durans IPLA 655]|uniref:GNAT family acetyltransferase n=1 Tax=Enterococcus durans ATCC 6056 TaxID=1140001 RepID=A0ABN0KKR1_9ENTE|nr:GNAT family N-acetyltransferase [Enterococcus durans]EMS76555.1 GNAT family acetyltransferase [Enterococcus durans IPLA 655]EOT23982.1 GNAT family acetyltransferase [Enterococcus durans ATCC 6056]EOU21678.1 GNAT family acetyltransferase [Enterococcus durans ATCC 6056]
MIREISIHDAEVLRNINSEQLGYDVSLELTTQQIKKLSKDKKNHIFLVYESTETNEVLGYVHAELYESIYSEPMFNILALAVSKKAEKRGIGKKLMYGLETIARQRNILAIRFNSGEKRHEAHKFYEHIGYKSDKLQKRFLKFLKGETDE